MRKKITQKHHNSGFYSENQRGKRTEYVPINQIKTENSTEELEKTGLELFRDPNLHDECLVFKEKVAKEWVFSKSKDSWPIETIHEGKGNRYIAKLPREPLYFEFEDAAYIYAAPSEKTAIKRHEMVSVDEMITALLNFSVDETYGEEILSLWNCESFQKEIKEDTNDQLATEKFAQTIKIFDRIFKNFSFKKVDDLMKYDIFSFLLAQDTESMVFPFKDFLKKLSVEDKEEIRKECEKEGPHPNKLTSLAKALVITETNAGWTDKPFIVSCLNSEKSTELLIFNDKGLCERIVKYFLSKINSEKSREIDFLLSNQFKRVLLEQNFPFNSEVFNHLKDFVRSQKEKNKLYSKESCFKHLVLITTILSGAKDQHKSLEEFMKSILNPEINETKSIIKAIKENKEKLEEETPLLKSVYSQFIFKYLSATSTNVFLLIPQLENDEIEEFVFQESLNDIFNEKIGEMKPAPLTFFKSLRPSTPEDALVTLIVVYTPSKPKVIREFLQDPKAKELLLKISCEKASHIKEAKKAMIELLKSLLKKKNLDVSYIKEFLVMIALFPPGDSAEDEQLVGNFLANLKPSEKLCLVELSRGEEWPEIMETCKSFALDLMKRELQDSKMSFIISMINDEKLFNEYLVNTKFFEDPEVKELMKEKQIKTENLKKEELLLKLVKNFKCHEETQKDLLELFDGILEKEETQLEIDLAEFILKAKFQAKQNSETHQKIRSLIKVYNKTEKKDRQRGLLTNPEFSWVYKERFDNFCMIVNHIDEGEVEKRMLMRPFLVKFIETDIEKNMKTVEILKKYKGEILKWRFFEEIKEQLEDIILGSLAQKGQRETGLIEKLLEQIEEVAGDQKKTVDIFISAVRKNMDSMGAKINPENILEITRKLQDSSNAKGFLLLLNEVDSVTPFQIQNQIPALDELFCLIGDQEGIEDALEKTMDTLGRKKEKFAGFDDDLKQRLINSIRDQSLKLKTFESFILADHANMKQPKDVLRFLESVTKWEGNREFYAATIKMSAKNESHKRIISSFNFGELIWNHKKKEKQNKWAMQLKKPEFEVFEIVQTIKNQLELEIQKMPDPKKCHFKDLIPYMEKNRMEALKELAMTVDIKEFDVLWKQVEIEKISCIKSFIQKNPSCFKLPREDETQLPDINTITSMKQLPSLKKLFVDLDSHSQLLKSQIFFEFYITKFSEDPKQEVKEIMIRARDKYFNFFEILPEISLEIIRRDYKFLQDFDSKEEAKIYNSNNLTDDPTISKFLDEFKESKGIVDKIKLIQNYQKLVQQYYPPKEITDVEKLFHQPVNLAKEELTNKIFKPILEEYGTEDSQKIIQTVLKSMELVKLGRMLEKTLIEKAMDLANDRSMSGFYAEDFKGIHFHAFEKLLRFDRLFRSSKSLKESLQDLLAMNQDEKEALEYLIKNFQMLKSFFMQLAENKEIEVHVLRVFCEKGTQVKFSLVKGNVRVSIATLKTFNREKDEITDESLNMVYQNLQLFPVEKSKSLNEEEKANTEKLMKFIEDKERMIEYCTELVNTAYDFKVIQDKVNQITLNTPIHSCSELILAFLHDEISNWVKVYDNLIFSSSFLDLFNKQEFSMVFEYLERPKTLRKASKDKGVMIGLLQMGCEWGKCFGKKRYFKTCVETSQEKLVCRFRTLENLLREVSNKFPRKPKNLPVILNNQIPPPFDPSSKRHSVLHWKVPLENFGEALLYTVLSMEKQHPHGTRILVLDENVEETMIGNFLIRALKQPEVLFYVLVPMTPKKWDTSYQKEAFRNSYYAIRSKEQFIGKHMQLVFVTDAKATLPFSPDARTEITALTKEFIDDSDVPRSRLSNILKSSPVPFKVLTSEISGNGKTWKAQQDSIRLGKEFKIFLLSGSTSLSKVIRRTQNAFLTSSRVKGILLNLVIGSPSDLENPEKIEEFCCKVTIFLISIIAFGGYRAKKSFFSMPSDSHLYIELSNAPGELIESSLEFTRLIQKEEHWISIPNFKLENFKPEGNLADKAKCIAYNLELMANKRLFREEIKSTRNLFYSSYNRDFGPLNWCPVFEKNLLSVMKKMFKVITFRIFIATLNAVYQNFESLKNCDATSIHKLSMLLETANGVHKDLTIRGDIMGQLLISSCYCTCSTMDDYLDDQIKAVRKLGPESSITERLKKLKKKQTDKENKVEIQKTPSCFMVVNDKGFYTVFKSLSDISPKIKEIYSKFIAIKECSVKRLSFPVPKEVSLGQLQHLMGTSESEKASQLLLGLIRNILMIPELSKGDFVLTQENVLRIVLITMKIMAGLPVILMGETGTGKTYTMKFMIEKLWNNLFGGLVPKLEYVLIHAGYTDELIIKKFDELAQIAAGTVGRKQIFFVFLDEFNTSRGVDLLSEILTSRSILGSPLPRNVITIGACNPLKLKEEDSVSFSKKNSALSAGLVHTRSQNAQAKKAYTVQHLTQAELGFVLDFENLSKQTREDYCTKIVHVFLKHEMKVDTELAGIISNCVVASIDFVIQLEGFASMSLRDLQKFKDVFRFMYQEYFLAKCAIDKDYQQKLSGQERILRSTSLTLAVVFMFRITLKTDRIYYVNLINELFEKTTAKELKSQRFEIHYKEELEFFMKSISLESGIAKTLPLSENCFALFVCLNIKMPILIVGKPGCSKTLSIRSTFKSMRGTQSDSKFFAQFPLATFVTYQGSETSTSEGVEEAFEKARERFQGYQKSFSRREKQEQSQLFAKQNAKKQTEESNKVRNEFRVALIFDEVGIAEVSPHNPLKVLHKYLDDKDFPATFIGISNWRLDDSKSNRTILVGRPDLDSNDAFIVSRKIFEDSDVPPTGVLLTILKALSNAYFYFIVDQQKKNIFRTLPSFTASYSSFPLFSFQILLIYCFFFVEMLLTSFAS